MGTRDEISRANARAKRLLKSGPTAVDARYDRRSRRVVLSLSNGIGVTFAANNAQGLEGATPSQLSTIEISPSGLGIHFPKLDADLYLPALLEGMFGSRRWMAMRLGQRGGRARSTAKAAASRRNGKLGGRPRKVSAR
jgi:hypothetical protein